MTKSLFLMLFFGATLISFQAPLLVNVKEQESTEVSIGQKLSTYGGIALIFAAIIAPLFYSDKKKQKVIELGEKLGNILPNQDIRCLLQEYEPLIKVVPEIFHYMVLMALVEHGPKKAYELIQGVTDDNVYKKSSGIGIRSLVLLKNSALETLLEDKIRSFLKMHAHDPANYFDASNWLLSEILDVAAMSPHAQQWDVSELKKLLVAVKEKTDAAEKENVVDSTYYSQIRRGFGGHYNLLSYALGSKAGFLFLKDLVDRKEYTINPQELDKVCFPEKPSQMLVEGLKKESEDGWRLNALKMLVDAGYKKSIANENSRISIFQALAAYKPKKHEEGLVQELIANFS